MEICNIRAVIVRLFIKIPMNDKAQRVLWKCNMDKLCIFYNTVAKEEDVDLPIDEDLYFEELSKRIAESRAGQKKNVIGEIEDNTCSFGGF